MRKNYSPAIMIFSIFLILFIQLPVRADTDTTISDMDLSELQQHQQQMLIEEKQTQEQLQETQTQKNQVEIEMEVIDNELQEATTHLVSLTERYELADSELVGAENELLNAKMEQKVQYSIMKKRIRYMYMNGNIGYLDCIFQAKSFADFINRVEYINRIVKNDRALVLKLSSLETLITEKINEIDHQKEVLGELAYEQEQEQSNLQTAMNKKLTAYEQLDADEEKYQLKLESLKKTELEVEELIIKAQKEAEEAAKAAAEAGNYEYIPPDANSAIQVYTGGKMMWPVPGRSNISSGYKSRRNPVNGRSEFHTGVDIPAPTGTSIAAAAAGVCIFSGWQSGYGYVVILDHGGGISTLYAHNSKLVAKVGERINKGQVISRCGSTGNSTGPHCHFEVRINGKHTNPMAYL